MKYQEIVNLIFILLNCEVALVKGDDICHSVAWRECFTLRGATRCYYDYPEKSYVGFGQAKHLCECNGYKMAMGQDEDIMRSMRNINFDFWMDVKRSPLKEFTFVQSGIEMDLSRPEQPTHKQLIFGEENHLCAYIEVPGGRGRIKYRADNCNSFRMSLCRQTKPCTEENCQKLSKNATYTTWYRQRYACHLESGDLAFSDNEANLSDLVHSMNLARGQYWIGLRKERWTWGNGTEMIYSDWDYTSGQPSTLSEKCVVSKSDSRARWIDLRCNENSGVLCFQDNHFAGDIPRNISMQSRRPTHKETKHSETKHSEVTPKPVSALPKPALYALVAVSSACGILILVLSIVLISSCRRQRRKRRVPDYCEIDELALASYSRTRTQTCSTDIPPDGSYEACGYLEPISYNAQPGEPVYSVIDCGTRKDSKDSRYLTLV